MTTGQKRNSQRERDDMTSPKVVDLTGLLQIFPCFTRAWMYRAMWAGTAPPHFKIGSKLMFNVAEVESWLEQHRRSSTSGS